MNPNKLLIFTASWCAPCRMLKQQLQGCSIPIELIDVEENPELANTYNVRSVPTIWVLDEGEVLIEKMIGYQPNKIKDICDNYKVK